MTQDERTLLHIDLSGRVPYDLVLKVKGLVTSNEEFGDARLDTVSWYEEVSVRDGSRVSYDIADVRPYLRSLSSMTKSERKEFDNLSKFDEDAWMGNHKAGFPKQARIMSKCIDWLNKKMFDHRGLIPKGLALEAPEGMYTRKI